MTELPSSNRFLPGVIGYLCSSKTFFGRGRRIASVVILLLWLFLVSFTSAKHEYWRDEVRALSTALEADSFWDLPATLKNEGHPFLWYAVLRAGYLLTGSTGILGIASVSLAFASVVIFYTGSPFPAWQKLVFLFSFFPIYEYSVMARNYGIGMLLVFLFALLYQRRHPNPFWIGCTLAALANTSAHACILAGALTIAWLLDDLVIGRRLLNTRRGIVLTCAFLIAAAGMLLSVITVIPTSSTIVTDAMSLSTSAYVKAAWTSFIRPGTHLTSFAVGMPAELFDVAFWLLAAGLLVRPHLAISFIAGNVVMGTFFTTVIPAHLRHQGLVLILAISLYWIAYGSTIHPKHRRLPDLLRLIYRMSLYLVLTTILFGHLVLSVRAIGIDLTSELSSSRALGRFIMSHPEFHDAIIMGEPDTVLEPLPYYVPNRIYLPRERRFGNRAIFTLDSTIRFSLGDLTQAALRIKRLENKPVLVLLGRIKPYFQRPNEYHYYHNKIFTTSDEEMAVFRSQTYKVASFDRAVSDENYTVYAVR